MESNTLGAFVVKRRNIVLPKLKYGERYYDRTFWDSIGRNIVHKEILIEAKEETVNGYNLYGTEIPVIFSYPSRFEHNDPIMEVCIGVRTEQEEITKVMREIAPNGDFRYKGKYITDEEVIAWLENEDNIESMQRVREWVYIYGKACEAAKEVRHQRFDGISRDITIRNLRQLEKEAEAAQKVKKLRDRRDEMVSRYAKF